MISIKGFHLFFIFASIVLSVWFAIYEVQQGFHGTSAILAVVSSITSVGLMVYGLKVYKKFKTL